MMKILQTGFLPWEVSESWILNGCSIVNFCEKTGPLVARIENEQPNWLHRPHQQSDAKGKTMKNMPCDVWPFFYRPRLENVRT